MFQTCLLDPLVSRAKKDAAFFVFASQFFRSLFQHHEQSFVPFE